MKAPSACLAALAAVLLSVSSLAHAEDAAGKKQKGGLGGFLKKLEQAIQQPVEGGANAMSPTAKGAAANPSGPPGQGQAKDFNRMQCEIEGVIVGEKQLRGKNIDGLVQQEFNLRPEEVFTQFKNAAAANRTVSYAFPNAYFYLNEFETRRIQALYASFVAYPEPATLALIIDEATSSKDQQTQNDAKVALAFIHLQMPQASKTPGRGQQLLDSLGNQDHYTYNVYRARRAAVGEGVPKNPQMAMALLVRSEAAAGNPLIGGGGQKAEMDRWNFRETRSKTVVDHDPSRRQMFLAAEAYQQQNLAAIPSKPYGRLLDEALRLSADAVDQGNAIVGLSQDQVTARAQIRSLGQLMEKRKTDPTTTVSPDPEAERKMAGILAAAERLSDTQKAQLNDAMAKRAAAVSLVTQARGMVLNEALSYAGDIERSIGMLPAIRIVNEAFYGSCKVYASWEQAARVAKLSGPDPKAEAAAAAAATSKIDNF